MTAPRRRWSFSLRTLFVVVTVLACGGARIAQQRAIVTARHASFERVRRTGGLAAEGGPGAVVVLNNGVRIGPAAPVPRVRGMLGDNSVLVIQLPPNESSDADAQHFQELFPEARIYKFDDLPKFTGACY